MLTDRDRIARQMGDPALVRLDRALSRLTSVITVMNTGAHPDDEISGLLAALRYRYGMRVVIACSTRGEGGQNAIGPERGGLLGVLRSRELEEAARVLDASIAWLGHGPDDPVFDFGFSKNGDDTLARWGEALVLERMVAAYRRYRPDIVAPTFLDVPGQHGHHRAMTRTAIMAMEAAADRDVFPEQIAAGLTPWRVPKLYLPAWSGAGNSYDDEVPPPEATVIVRAPERDIVSGASYAQIGEWSRFYHASQRMGVWRDAGKTEWPLHLAVFDGRNPVEEAITDGLPEDLGALAALRDVPAAMRAALSQAQSAIDSAITAFPRRADVVEAALAAAEAIDRAHGLCPPALGPMLLHRLERKAREIDAVVLIASGFSLRATPSVDRAAPGQSLSVTTVAAADRPFDDLAVYLRTGGDLAVSGGERSEDGSHGFDIAVAEKAKFSSSFPASFDPLRAEGEVSVVIDAVIGGRAVRGSFPLEAPLRVLPPVSLVLEPDALIVNLQRPIAPMVVRGTIDRLDRRAGGQVSLDTPAGWSVRNEASVSAGSVRLTLTPPAGLKPGTITMTPKVDGRPAYRTTTIGYQHVGEIATASPVGLPVLAVDAALPSGAKVGYVGSGNDRVGIWMHRLGIDVTPLDAETLLRGDLAAFSTIVVGIFAFGIRQDLKAARGRLKSWVETGGHLVTLYHRPSDGWVPEETPPRRLKIGLPSLRWRVTDPAAAVTVLTPDHPLLTRPNKIGPADWDGWDKERGLYFAAEWDKAYQPLLAMSDPGEKPLKGALLSGVIGRGRHTHTSLVLHHQLDRLVPGAFRLIANLVQPA